MDVDVENNLSFYTKFYSIFSHIKFGVEIETCLHITDQQLFVSEQEQDIKDLYMCICSCGKQKLPCFSWNYEESPQKKNYDSWTVTNDFSIDCDKNERYCVIEGKESKDCPTNITFVNTEIVSPVLQGFEGLEDLYVFWYGFFTGDNMIQKVNNTQGLHVNLSHPDLNYNNFSKLWTYYEPVIWQLIPERRRRAALTYAKPIFTLTEEQKLKKSKYRSIRIHGMEETKRVEIRIQEGLFIYNDLINWILLLMIILTMSVYISKYSWKKRFYTKYQDILKDFFKAIQDENLTNHFINIYNKNKSSNYPVYVHTEETTDLNLNIITDEVKNRVQKAREIKCTDFDPNNELRNTIYTEVVTGFIRQFLRSVKDPFVINTIIDVCVEQCCINYEQEYLEDLKYIFNNAKVDINGKMRLGEPFLIYAARAHNYNLVKLLLEYKANPNIVYGFETPLISVVFSSEKNPDTNNSIFTHTELPDTKGMLMYTYESDDDEIQKKDATNILELVKLLVKYGADINKEVCGKSAYDIAHERNQKEIVDYMLSIS